MISISSPLLAGYQDDPAFTGKRGQCHAPIADNAVHAKTAKAS
jgi:hypothetical protein